MVKASDLLPKWTRRVVTETTGRDPLGLSRVSNTITDFLLTGITATTGRARYYSFYCWNLWRIAETEAPRKYADFVTAFRQREAVVAMASLVHNPDSSPVGVEVARPNLEQAQQVGEVDPDFKVLPSSELGGYGQYYSGSIYQLGLSTGDELGIHSVTDSGKQLALAFHGAVSACPYIQKSLFKLPSFAFSDLSKSARYLSLDAIREDRASSERELLINLFFGFDGNKKGNRIGLRSNTLGHVLFILSRSGEAGYYPEMGKIDEDFVYSPYYYETMKGKEGQRISYGRPEMFRFSALLWRQFCLHQYFTQALELLFFSLLEIIGQESSGLRLEEAIHRILLPSFYETLGTLLGEGGERPMNVLHSLGLSAVPNIETSERAQKKRGTGSTLSERKILALDEENSEVSAAKAVLLFGLLYAKWRGARDLAVTYVSQHVQEQLWFGNFMSSLDGWLEPSLSWAEALKMIIQTFIINQHDRVMYEKGRLESCWVSTTEGRLSKEQDYSPRWRANRHLRVITILQDLNLIDIDEDGCMSITTEGEKVLERVLKE